MINSLIRSVLISGLFLFIMCKSPEAPAGKLNIVFDDSSALKSSAPFPVGASVNVRLLKSDPVYRNTLTSEFNSITCENAMKWEAVHPQTNEYSFADADSIVNFALKNHIRIHGHNLAWYQANPAWLDNFQGNAAAWESLLKDHINTVVSRYKGKVNSWDVVNEAFDENGQGRKNDLWAKHIGEDYIAKAFEFAHKADPGALLFYNDYGQEESSAKTAAILLMIRDLQKKHVPINGVGLQMHITLNSPNNAIKNIMERFASTGLLIHISELDIVVNTKHDKALKLTPELENAQAAKYKFIVDAYRSIVPKSQQYGITTWNVGDKDSWIRHFYHQDDWPLLFNDKYEKKPAYYAFLQALKSADKK